MRPFFLVAFTCSFFNCNNACITADTLIKTGSQEYASPTFPKSSWQYFLQHLPIIDAPIKDYTGKSIANQSKHVAVVNYDIGTSDLQQCADALMRLRAEYLFASGKINDIGFHFCDGKHYSFNMYCQGIKPVLKGSVLTFISSGKIHQANHASLKRYLDIVYMYANTISLCKELKPANSFEVGTVIITPGSPGHTCIIIDEVINDKKEKLYKLAESYMPAQSIYILSNPYDESINPWYKLSKDEIITASYHFTSYQLKKFE